MDVESEWMRELIQQPAGTPIDAQALARIRLFICLTADSELIDLIETIREARQVTGQIPQAFDRYPDREEPLIGRLLPTRPTRPGTAAGVVELVRRGPDLFKQLPVSYQLEALRAVVIRRNREQEELSRSVKLAAANARAEQQRQKAHVAQAREDSPQLQTWVAGQTTELGFPSIGVHAFIANVLDPEAEGRDYDFYELLVDQRFTLPELRQMIAILDNRLQVRKASLQDYFDNMTPDADQEDKEYVEGKLTRAHSVLEKHARTDVEAMDVDVLQISINHFLMSVVEMEDLIADFEAQLGEDRYPEYVVGCEAEGSVPANAPQPMEFDKEGACEDVCVPPAAVRSASGSKAGGVLSTRGTPDEGPRDTDVDSMPDSQPPCRQSVQ